MAAPMLSVFVSLDDPIVENGMVFYKTWTEPIASSAEVESLFNTVGMAFDVNSITRIVKKVYHLKYDLMELHFHKQKPLGFYFERESNSDVNVFMKALRDMREIWHVSKYW